MNRKRALGLFHKLYHAYMEVLPYERYQLPEEGTFRNELYEALKMFSLSALGKPACGYYPGLCGFCHEAYAVKYVYVSNPNASYPLGSSACSSCYASLLAQGMLLEADGQPLIQ